jgi:hypothetical protein
MSEPSPKLNDLLAALQAQQPPPDPNAKPEGLGCGCIGLAVVGLFVVYGVAWAATSHSQFTMVAVVLFALAVLGAAQVRGYHLLSVAAWASLGVIAFAMTPVAFHMIFPSASVAFLPGPLQTGLVPYAIMIGGAFSLGLALTQMKKSISTEETLTSIKIQAALKRASSNLGEQAIERALALLKESASLGAFPLGAEFMQDDNAPALPLGVGPSEGWLPVTVVHANPSKEGEWSEAHDPWLAPPARWESTVPKMGPIFVGTLYAHESGLRFVRMNGKDTIEIPAAQIARFKLRVHAIELMVGDQEYAFVGTHVWRLLSLALFLRAFEVSVADRDEDEDEDEEESEEGDDEQSPWLLWAKQARPKVRVGGLGRAPSEYELQRALRRRLEEARTEAQRMTLEDMGTWAYKAPWTRAAAAELLEAWGKVEEGDSREANRLLERLDERLEVFGEECHGPVWSVVCLVEELRMLLAAKQELWGELLEFVADLEPWEDDAPDAQEALVSAVQALGRGDRSKARERLDKARPGYLGMLAMDALDSAVGAPQALLE